MKDALRAFVNTFPPLKTALYVYDIICLVFSLLLDLVYYVVKSSLRLVSFVVRNSYGPLIRWTGIACSKLADALPPIRRFKEEQERRKYARLKELHAKGLEEPVPYYEQQLLKRAITYHGGLLLAASMFIFVYFVLIKHHTYLSVSVAFVLLLVYLILVENSHNIRSIIMLCLPIMFTNRGRALVFCAMLALLAGGPMRTMHHNVKEIHLSLNCCKQYLIVHTDKYVGDNVVNKLVKMEEVVVNLVNNIKTFANDLKHKFDAIIRMAIATERFIAGTIDKLKDALKYCQRHSAQDAHRSCAEAVSKMAAQCNSLLNTFGVCTIAGRLKSICETATFHELLCQLPRNVMEFFERTIGQKLAEYFDLLEREFYVNVDIKRDYAYNVTKSKSYSEMTREIKFDVEQKFWYFRTIRRVFNFVSLILVTWIFLTATIYHMHYLRELSYDNMYLDERLDEAAYPVRISLKPDHEKLYLKPFSLHMNKVEVSKLYVSGFVWSVIVGYIAFFVTVDFSFYQLVDFLVKTLREILFTSDLPLIDLATKTSRTKGTKSGTSDGEDRIVKYNRTYLSSLRKRFKSQLPTMGTNLTRDVIGMSNGTSSTSTAGGTLYTTNGTVIATQNSTSSIQAFYDRLMESLERDIPDDVAILESLEGCLPKAQEPLYGTYKTLLWLAIFTFCAVIVEAYALRTRHCIANLYYPRRARRRAKWLFRKIMSEKPKYEDDEVELIKSKQDDNEGAAKDGQPEQQKMGQEQPSPDLIDLDEEAPLEELNDYEDPGENQPDERSSLGYGFKSVE